MENIVQNVKLTHEEEKNLLLAQRELLGAQLNLTKTEAAIYKYASDIEAKYSGKLNFQSLEVVLSKSVEESTA